MNTNFENQLAYNKITFQRSNRLSITEREIHSYHEILFCMDADATLFTETQQQRLQGDVILLIPKERYHFLRVDGGEKFPRLKIAFPHSVLQSIPCGDFMGELCRVENAAVLQLMKKLCSILEQEPDERQGFYAYAVFMLLLAELDHCRLEHTVLPVKEENEQQNQILDYISKHLSQDLSIEKLAKQMNLSPSGITHNFKKEMGISVHQYITQRRMTYAQNLLRAGEKASNIYTDCGYKNYSSFYKAYISFYGHPPSVTK
jgi:AraC-like DNA-binding protein